MPHSQANAAGGGHVIVVGGGMVGALTSLAMARCDLRVTLVEKSTPKEFDIADHDIRVSAISHATLSMFKALGAWDYIHDLRACPFKRMHVWDKSGSAQTSFDSSNIGHQQLGFIVENSLIQDSLWRQLKTLANVEILSPASVVAFESGDDSASITLNSGQHLQADLIVAADGSRSALRSLADIAVDGESYDQHALVATVSTELPQQDITWQRFTDTGPQAFLPLVGNRASIVWYHSKLRIAELCALSDNDFIESLQTEFPDRLGKILAVERRGSFPLQWSHATRYVKPGFALAGDAAHAVHPLAGQGVNLGMLDAAVLLQCVADGMAAGRNIGSMRVLRRYERWRKPANELMIRLLDGIQRAFQPDDFPEYQAHTLKSVRTAALHMADSIAPLNKTCIRSAMGLAGELPALATGHMPDTVLPVA